MMLGLHVTLCDALWPCYTRPWCSSQVLFCIFYIFPSDPDYGDHLTFSLQLLSISNRGHLQILHSNKTIFIVLRHGHWPYSSFTKRISCKCIIPYKQLTVITTQSQCLWSTHRLRDHISGDTSSLKLRATGCWLAPPFHLGAGKSVSIHLNK